MKLLSMSRFFVCVLLSVFLLLPATFLNAAVVEPTATQKVKCRIPDRQYWGKKSDEDTVKSVTLSYSGGDARVGCELGSYGKLEVFINNDRKSNKGFFWLDGREISSDYVVSCHMSPVFEKQLQQVGQTTPKPRTKLFYDRIVGENTVEAPDDTPTGGLFSTTPKDTSGGDTKLKQTSENVTREYDVTLFEKVDSYIDYVETLRKERQENVKFSQTTKNAPKDREFVLICDPDTVETPKITPKYKSTVKHPWNNSLPLQLAHQRPKTPTGDLKKENPINYVYIPGEPSDATYEAYTPKTDAPATKTLQTCTFSDYFAGRECEPQTDTPAVTAEPPAAVAVDIHSTGPIVDDQRDKAVESPFFPRGQRDTPIIHSTGGDELAQKVQDFAQVGDTSVSNAEPNTLSLSELDRRRQEALIARDAAVAQEKALYAEESRLWCKIGNLCSQKYREARSKAERAQEHYLETKRNFNKAAAEVDLQQKNESQNTTHADIVNEKTDTSQTLPKHIVREITETRLKQELIALEGLENPSWIQQGKRFLTGQGGPTSEEINAQRKRVERARQQLQTIAPDSTLLTTRSVEEQQHDAIIARSATEEMITEADLANPGPFGAASEEDFEDIKKLFPDTKPAEETPSLRERTKLFYDRIVGENVEAPIDPTLNERGKVLGKDTETVNTDKKATARLTQRTKLFYDRIVGQNVIKAPIDPNAPTENREALERTLEELAQQEKRVTETLRGRKNQQESNLQEALDGLRAEREAVMRKIEDINTQEAREKLPDVITTASKTNSQQGQQPETNAPNSEPSEPFDIPVRAPIPTGSPADEKKPPVRTVSDGDIFEVYTRAKDAQRDLNRMVKSQTSFWPWVMNGGKATEKEIQEQIKKAQTLTQEYQKTAQVFDQTRPDSRHAEIANKLAQTTQQTVTDAKIALAGSDSLSENAETNTADTQKRSSTKQSETTASTQSQSDTLDGNQTPSNTQTKTADNNRTPSTNSNEKQEAPDSEENTKEDTTTVKNKKTTESPNDTDDSYSFTQDLRDQRRQALEQAQRDSARRQAAARNARSQQQRRQQAQRRAAPILVKKSDGAWYQPSCEITADTTSITQEGDPVKIKWTTERARTATLNGQKLASEDGEITVRPTKEPITTYILEAKSVIGTTNTCGIDIAVGESAELQKKTTTPTSVEYYPFDTAIQTQQDIGVIRHLPQEI